MNNLRLLKLVLLFIATAYAPNLFAHDNHKASSVLPEIAESILFIKNAGQWDDPYNYRASIPGGSMFLTNDGFVYNFASTEDLNKANEVFHDGGKMADVMLNMHSFKVNLVNKNTNTTYVNNKRSNTVYSYFYGNDRSKWKGNVGAFSEIVEKNVYNGIDLLVNSENNAVKYDFIVAPNADPNQIRLSFEGVTPFINEAGELVYETTVNTLKEKAPYVYQDINGQRTEVAAKFVLNKGVLSFEFPNGYDKSHALVVDPDLIFSTFTGATSTNVYPYSTTYDLAGCLYIASDAFTVGWPVTIGAYKQNHAGNGNELAIMKFHALGTGVLYATYMGGNGQDFGTSSWVKDNELYIFGGTSSSNFPTTPGAFSTTKQGTWDAFVLRLGAGGDVLLGSTYMGGTNDEVYQLSFTVGSFNFGSFDDLAMNWSSQLSPGDLTLDAAGNIWVTTNTQSTDFPTTSNAPILTHSGGWDGVLFALDPSCSQLLYSTYFGGSGDEVPHSILLGKNDDIYVGGTTNSNASSAAQFPTTTGAFNTVANGAMDGFIMRFNTMTGGLMQSTVVGTAGDDQVAHLQMDKDGLVYALGRTTGNYLVENANWSGSPNGNVFISIFDADLSQRFRTTRLGTVSSTGSSYYMPSAFLVDDCGNLFVAGFGTELNMPLTDDAYERTRLGFWFCKISRNFNSLIYASYFGETTADHSHIGKHRFDPEGVVYQSICSNPGMNQVMRTTSPASFAPRKLTTGQDVLSFKFNFEKVGVSSLFNPNRANTPKDSFCAPHTVQFENTSKDAQRFIWYFGDGDSSVLATPTHIYTNPGVYQVQLVAINDTMCITHDTAHLEVHVYEISQPQLVVKDTNLCSVENSINIGVAVLNPSLGNPGNVYQWSPAAGIIGPSNTATITVDPTVGRVYTVRVVDSVAGVCSNIARATVNINVTPRTLDILTSDTSVCEGSVLNMRAIGSPGYTYKWSPSLGVGDTTQLEPTILANQSTIYTLTASYPQCIDTSVMFYLDVEKYPHLQLVAPTEVCEKREVEMTTGVSPYRSDYTYVWTPTTGLSINNGPNTTWIADTSRHYQVKVATPAGCSDSVMTLIKVNKKGNSDAISGADYCAPGSAQLWATNGKSYLWEPSTGLDDATKENPITSVTTNTNYNVYVTDVNGCIDTLSVLVEVHPKAVLGLPDTITVYSGEGYQVAANTNAMHFEWFPPSGVSNPNASDPFLSPTVRTKYTVTATTEFGCEAVQTLDVLVANPEINMPNAYAPNNEGAKIFKPVIRGAHTLKTFAIFNRWGTKIYESTNINECWDGTYKGVAQEFGVYVYVIEAVNDQNEVYSQTGNVTLIR